MTFNANLSNNPLLQTDHIIGVISEYEASPQDFKLAPDFPMETTKNDRIVVDIRRGAGGMTKGAAMHAESPTVEFGGRAQFSFEPAAWREKVILTSKELDKVRRLGTKEEIQTASEVISEKSLDLRTRLETRMEWMRWQALKGSLAYAGPDVSIGPIDYGIPAEMTPTLTGADRWTQSTSDIMDDILAWNELYADVMAEVDHYEFNQFLHRTILQNSTMRTLRDTLFSGQPNLGNLTPGNLQAIFNHYAGVPYQIYNGGYIEYTSLTEAATSSDTTLVVQDLGTIGAGDTIVITHRDSFVSGLERLTVSSVAASTKTITVASPGTSQAFSIGSTIRVKKRFIENDEFIIRGRLPGSIEGGPIWGKMVATTHPYGGNFQNTGIISVVNVHELADPPKVEIIVGGNMLPVILHPDVNVIASVNG